MVTKYVVEDFACKYCGSKDLVRYGLTDGMQYWWCNKCKRKFADNKALPEMKTPTNQITSALNMYYEGMSLNAIRRHLDQQHGNLPSKSTIYEWIDRFTDEAVRKSRQHKPDVGDVWVADETVLKIGGKKVWFWDIIDVKSRFLLASHMSTNRTIGHARTLVEKASKRAGKTPKVIITDQLYAYLDGIELAFGADTRHVQSKGFRVQPNTNVIERFHGTLKGRTKVMRGLKKVETARHLMDGWLVHYNFFRPHEALNDRTPAEKAGIKSTFVNWRDIVHKPIIKAPLVTKPVVIYERVPLVPKLKTPRVRMTPPMPRITPRVRLPRGDMYVGRGLISRHPFSGSRSVRLRGVRRGRRR